MGKGFLTLGQLKGIWLILWLGNILRNRTWCGILHHGFLARLPLMWRDRTVSTQPEEQKGKWCHCLDWDLMEMPWGRPPDQKSGVQ